MLDQHSLSSFRFYSVCFTQIYKYLGCRFLWNFGTQWVSLFRRNRHPLNCVDIAHCRHPDPNFPEGLFWVFAKFGPKQGVWQWKWWGMSFSQRKRYPLSKSPKNALLQRIHVTEIYIMREFINNLIMDVVFVVKTTSFICSHRPTRLSLFNFNLRATNMQTNPELAIPTSDSPIPSKGCRFNRVDVDFTWKRHPGWGCRFHIAPALSFPRPKGCAVASGEP